MFCLLRLFCRLEGRRGVAILTLCLFGVQCAYVHGLVVISTCAVFHVLFSRVCVVRMGVTIAKMLYICYHQGSIALAVCAACFYFHFTRFSLFSPRPPFCCCCVVFPRTIEIMNQIEISRLICLLLLNMGNLVIAYTTYEENTPGHAAPIYDP